MQSAPAPHRRNAVGRLQRPDQHRARGAFLLADEIDAPVDAVGAIDVAKAGRAEHHFVARRRPTERMRGRIGVMIGLDLDDDAADTVYQQRRADQIGGDLVHAAGKERALERPAEVLAHRTRHIPIGWDAALIHSAGQRVRERTDNASQMPIC